MTLLDTANSMLEMYLAEISNFFTIKNLDHNVREIY